MLYDFVKPLWLALAALRQQMLCWNIGNRLLLIDMGVVRWLLAGVVMWLLAGVVRWLLAGLYSGIFRLTELTENCFVIHLCILLIIFKYNYILFE